MSQVLGIIALTVLASGTAAAVIGYNNTIEAVDQKIENRGVNIENTKGAADGIGTLDELGKQLWDQVPTVITDHIDNKDIHRELNDAVHSSTTLWSASKTKTYTDTEIKSFVTDREAQPLGLATLNALGKLLTAQLPDLALISICVCADIAARDALTVQSGDGAIVLDDGFGEKQLYIYDGAAWLAAPSNSETVAMLKTLYLEVGDYVHINELRMDDGAGNYAKITKQAGVGTYDIKLPQGASANNTFLRATDGVGTMAWSLFDHGGLAGNADDDHLQYALLAGRGAGQTLVGGTGANNNLQLRSTSHLTRGVVFTNDEFRCDKIDCDSGTIFQIGPSIATEVHIAQSGVQTLAMGQLRAVEGMASTGVNTDVNGPLTAKEGLTVDTLGIGVTAGDLTLTAGNLNLTLGDATLTDGNLTLTSGDALLSDGNMTLTTGNIVLSQAGATVDGVDVTQLKSDHDTHSGDATIHFTEASIDHGSIAGLGDDDHTQYALLAGRSNTQTLSGGDATNGTLVLRGTSHVTPGTASVDVVHPLQISSVLGGVTTKIVRPDSGSAHTLTLPNANGNGFLLNNGSGSLSWVSAPVSVYGFSRRDVGHTFTITSLSPHFTTQHGPVYVAGGVTYDGPSGEFTVPAGRYRIYFGGHHQSTYAPTISLRIYINGSDQYTVEHLVQHGNTQRDFFMETIYDAVASVTVKFGLFANGAGDITLKNISCGVQHV